MIVGTIACIVILIGMFWLFWLKPDDTHSLGAMMLITLGCFALWATSWKSGREYAESRAKHSKNEIYYPIDTPKAVLINDTLYLNLKYRK
jgi:putative Mn2+ efflux pump MntP